MRSIIRKLNASTLVILSVTVVIGIFSLMVAFGFFSDKISAELSASSGTLSTTITNTQVNTGSWTNVPSDGNMTSQIIAMDTTKPFRFDATTPVILNGTGMGAETETGGLSAHTAAVTIYFDTAALNAAQGKTVAVQTLVEAIQYRNNTSPVWTTLEQIN